MPDFSILFAALLFGTAGLAAFVYGKKNASWRPMVVGVALMVYPYFVEQTWLLYGLGVALCAALFFWHE